MGGGGGRGRKIKCKKKYNKWRATLWLCQVVAHIETVSKSLSRKHGRKLDAWLWRGSEGWWAYCNHKGLKHQSKQSGIVSLEWKPRGCKSSLPLWYKLLPDHPQVLGTCQNRTLCRPSCYLPECSVQPDLDAHSSYQISTSSQTQCHEACPPAEWLWICRHSSAYRGMGNNRISFRPN